MSETKEFRIIICNEKPIYQYYTSNLGIESSSYNKAYLSVEKFQITTNKNDLINQHIDTFNFFN